MKLPALLLAVAAATTSPVRAWSWESALPEDAPVRLHLALRHEAAAERALAEIASAVSFPCSSKYGQFLSVEELAAVVAPPAARLAVVTQWIEAHLGAEATVNRFSDVVTVTAPAAVVNAAFDCELGVWRHGDERTWMRSRRGHRLPMELRDAITLVAGLTEPFPRAQPAPSRADQRASAPTGTNCLYEPGPTPSCLNSHYGVNITSDGTSGASIAIVEFAASYYLESDLAEFQRRYGTEVQSVGEVVGVIPSSASAGVEASLDVQWAMAVAQGVPSVVYQIPSTSSTPFLDWTTAALDDDNTPKVHSVSWGTPEYEYEDEVGVDTLNFELQKFVALGISVLVASGDDGAGCHDLSYMPNFPAASPFVTAVGGVYIPPITSTYAIEGDSISGGGFATADGNNRTQAPWQEDVVTAYQASPACASASMFVASGRGVPDVASYDAYFNFVRNGAAAQTDGTSAAAPVWAGIVALLNDQRLAAGLPVMGFINPWLYSLADAFPDALTDITSGTNNYGGCLHTGYRATKGWDAVTGLGTPVFPELLTAALEYTRACPAN